MAERQVLLQGVGLLHRALGAQCLGGASGKGPLFYVSPLSSPDMPVRGGVPVLFPQFADVGPLPKHGWVRNVPWTPVPTAPGSADAFAYQLDIQPTDRSDWPHACRLLLRVTPAAASLRIRLAVHNTGDTTFAWTGGLHPYWLLDQLLHSHATGLQGVAVRDRYDPAVRQQEAAELRWTDQPFERLYNACPPVQLHTGTHTLTLTAGGFNEWMVWNPGASGAAALADLPDGDWRRFVCIEPVCVSRPVVMAPGALFEGWLQADW